jgi:hypothetical protein
MIKTRPWIVLAVLLVLIVCSGCHKNSVSTPSGTTGGEANRHIQKQLAANLSVDAIVTAPADLQKLNTYIVAPLSLSTQTGALEAALIGNSKIAQRSGPGQDVFIKTDDGKELGIAKDRTVYFSTAYFDTYLNQLLLLTLIPGDTQPDLSYFNSHKNKDLPFMPRLQAVDKVRQLLSALGISVYDPADVYALDYKTLQARENTLKVSGKLLDPKTRSVTVKSDWNEQDDCYYMFLRGGLDGLPVYSEPHGNIDSGAAVQGFNDIQACYSKRGFEYLNIMFPFRIIRVDQAGIPIIGPEQALAAVTHKYDNVILQNPLTITAIELDYVPTVIGRTRDQFRMVPAWCFLMDVKVPENGVPKTVHQRVIIDATTGSEIL